METFFFLAYKPYNVIIKNIGRKGEGVVILEFELNNWKFYSNKQKYEREIINLFIPVGVISNIYELLVNA